MAAMDAPRLIPLGRGSPGNATLVCAPGFHLLIDAGLSCRALETRMREVGVDPDRLDAILLTHEHQDHARGAERFSLRHSTPVVGSRRALEAMNRSPVHFAEWVSVVAGAPVEISGARVEAFPVSHDAAEPFGFVIEGGGMRVGFATDLGAVTGVVVEKLANCDALLVESNHDFQMLQDGPYPKHLKDRVSGARGHLSNDEAGTLLEEVDHPQLRTVILAHLSENNNRPQLALARARESLANVSAVRVSVAEMRCASSPVVLGEMQ